MSISSILPAPSAPPAQRRGVTTGGGGDQLLVVLLRQRDRVAQVDGGHAPSVSGDCLSRMLLRASIGVVTRMTPLDPPDNTEAAATDYRDSLRSEV